LELVYAELRRRADHFLFREHSGQTLQATELVHEAWLRLGGDQGQQWQGQTHFLAAATLAMRRILIDRARTKARVKHGEGQKPLNLDDMDVATPDTAADTLLAVNDALEKLAKEEPEKARLVELRYFVGASRKPRTPWESPWPRPSGNGFTPEPGFTQNCNSKREAPKNDEAF
jgi:RNA polymerase sigma factor (TIGR02999 family)